MYHLYWVWKDFQLCNYAFQARDSIWLFIYQYKEMEWRWDNSMPGWSVHGWVSSIMPSARLLWMEEKREGFTPSVLSVEFNGKCMSQPGAKQAAKQWCWPQPGPTRSFGRRRKALQQRAALWNSCTMAQLLVDC